MAAYHVSVGESSILLDIGSGALRNMLHCAIPYTEIDAVLISHFHLDHVADLPALMWALVPGTNPPREKSLSIFGPPGLKDWYSAFVAAHHEVIAEPPFPVELLEVCDEDFRFHDFTMQTRTLRHSAHNNGYRLESSGRVLAYTGDTGFCSAAIELANSADVLLVDCSFADDKAGMDYHLTPSGIGEIAQKAGVSRILLTHMYPEALKHDLVGQTKKVFAGSVKLAEDLARHTI